MSIYRRDRCYAPRPTRFAGIVEHLGWRLKRYDITIDGSPVPDTYTQGFSAALAVLPNPAQTPLRPGVGFVVLHPGREAHYIVPGWWDNHNELMLHTIVHTLNPPGPWIDGGDNYSFCVWDLRVVWHERNAFVRHVMSPAEGPNINAYLADTLSPDAPGA